MIRLTSYIRIFLFIIASTIFLSCNESNIGIFYGIETEVKLIDNSLSNDITTGSMARANNTLYIGTGKVYAKNPNRDWYKLSTPSDFDLSTSITTIDDTDLYAIFYNIDGTNKGLFKLGAGDSWTQVSTSSLQGTVEMVKSANNTLFVSTKISVNVGKLYYSNDDGANFIEILTLIGSDFHVTYNGTTYWLANSNNIYIYHNNDLSIRKHERSIDDDYKITSLTPGFNSSYIYFSVWRVDSTSREGYLYALSDNNGISEKDNISYVINGIKCFSIDGNNFILAATAGRGYYYDEFYTTTPDFNTGIELERSKSNNILAQNYTSATDMHYSVALNFFMVTEPIGAIASGGDLYLLTVNNGLWKNSESGGFRNWSIE